MATCTTTLISIDGIPAQPAGPPQGRLTLVTGLPVMTASQSDATTIYYTPYNGNQVPIYNGSNLLSTSFTELSNITTNSSTGNAGPAAVAASSNYDLFVWSNGGTVTLTRGPAWTSDTARGTGAGTTELQRINGVLTNKVAITNGPAANLGTYVGTVRSDGSSQINYVFGATSDGGTAAVLGIWNAYNRVEVRGFIGDSTNSWTYNGGTFRAADNSTTMRVSFLQGLAEDFFMASYYTSVGSGFGVAYAGVGYNSTSTASGRRSYGGLGADVSVNVIKELSAKHAVQQLGWGFLQALENADGSNIQTFYGDNGGASLQEGLQYQGRF